MNTPDELLNIASLILYKFTENKETWTEYDTLAQALENTPTTNPQLQIKINARTQEFRQRQHTQHTTHYEHTQRDLQTDPYVQTMPTHLIKDRPNFYYYTIPKTPQDMTRDELVQEIRAANTAHTIAKTNQSSISTKETVRKRNCEQELLNRPNGIEIWNQELAD